MRSFSGLLREYTARTGVSDAELARALGVRRQTIFQWKEGLVEKPRSREDVLRCATKLRLSPEERDQFLLSAGFAPESPQVVTTQALLLRAQETPLADTESEAAIAAYVHQLSHRP